jgi:beta-glucosidase
MDIWCPGSEGAAAVANLLFGDAVPGGKAPITWMRSAAHAPMTYAHLTSHDRSISQADGIDAKK